MINQRNAIKMLHSRINLLCQYVAAVQSGTFYRIYLAITLFIVSILSKPGKLARDHSIMRRIASLCNRLPTMNSTEFHREFQIVSLHDKIVFFFHSAKSKIMS